MKRIIFLILLTSFNYTFATEKTQQNLYDKMQNTPSEEKEEGNLRVLGKTLLHTGIDATVIGALFLYHLRKVMPYIEDIKKMTLKETDSLKWGKIHGINTSYPHATAIVGNILLFALEAFAFTTIHRGLVFYREKNKRNTLVRKAKEQKTLLETMLQKTQS